MKQKKKQEKCESFIECLDYSPALDLIAYGETHGKVGFLDSLTLEFKGLFECHN